MKYPTTEEYIGKITDLLKSQNRIVNKYFKAENDIKILEKETLQATIQKFETIKKYVSNELFPALMRIKNNDRYIFKFVDDYLTEQTESYFKLLIINKVSNMNNFVLVNYDMREFIVKIKTPNAADDADIITERFPIDKFSQGKFRKIFFEYLEGILTLDTLPSKLANKNSSKEKGWKAKDITNEIDRMQKITNRNQQLLENTNNIKNSTILPQQ
jgi:hypothetical protein